MLDRRALALLSLLAAPLFAQFEPPVITSVEPRSGSYNGGNTVTIHGTNLTGPCTISPCPTTVWFGSTPVNTFFSGQEEVRVTAPPHRLGAFDIRIERLDHQTGLAEDAYVFTSDSSSKMFLVPLIMTRRSGASGSIWSTHLTIHNASLINTRISPIVIDLAPGGSAHDPEALASTASESAPGRILNIPSDAADEAEFHLRALDENKAAESDGFEIPVVREGDLRVDNLTLLDIPTDPRYRTTLRIYMLNYFDDRGEASLPFLVQIFDADGIAPIVTKTVNVTTHRANNPNAGILLYPATYEEVDLVGKNPQLAGHARLRVTITPVFLFPQPSHFPLFWAFDSTTNNATQQVTLITPQ